MQDLALKNQDAATLAQHLNSHLGTDMRACVQLYDGKYVDAERYGHTRNELLRVIPQLSSGTVHAISEMLFSGCWDSFGKKERQMVRRCVMHLAVTREVNLKFFTQTDSGNPLFQVV